MALPIVHVTPPARATFCATLVCPYKRSCSLAARRVQLLGVHDAHAGTVKQLSFFSQGLPRHEPSYHSSPKLARKCRQDSVRACRLDNKLAEQRLLESQNRSSGAEDQAQSEEVHDDLAAETVSSMTTSSSFLCRHSFLRCRRLPTVSASSQGSAV